MNRLSFCQIVSIIPQLTTCVYVYNKKNIVKTVNYGQCSLKKIEEHQNQQKKPVRLNSSKPARGQ